MGSQIRRPGARVPWGQDLSCREEFHAQSPRELLRPCQGILRAIAAQRDGLHRGIAMGTTDDAVVRVGIAGLGRAGWGIHANALAALPDKYRVVAAVDADESRQAEAQARFGCRAY